MRQYAQRGLDDESIPTEIDERRPFDAGSTEARRIRDRSRPLFAIEMTVDSLSGLPNTFSSRVAAFATEVEDAVLGVVDDGKGDIEAIRERILANVQALSDGQEDADDDAIDRLVTELLLERDGDAIRLR